MQLTQRLLDGIMAGITETGNILDPAAVFVGLMTAVSDSGLNTVIGDITEPTGDPGVRIAITAWGTAYRLVNGCVVRDGPSMTWRPADNTEACTVIGWYMADAITAGNLLSFGLFPVPYFLPDENYSASVVARVTVDPSGQWDATTSWNG